MLTFERSGRGIGRRPAFGREEPIGRKNWVRFVQTGFGQRQPISAANSLPALTKLVGRFALGFHLGDGLPLKDVLQLHRAISVGSRQVGLLQCCRLDWNASYS